ncbi:endonuclease [Arcobacter sp. F2176]|uniref:endonuclease n=1 Tax=Arcobacter sp. F2176 TaxID=2044511 RepID=UPI00100AF814|nr:endonuclease [Arcobacter sp. F2176]RXJ79342.1 deoxyribonuclease [Arcobacter sp. F2176]
MKKYILILILLLSLFAQANSTIDSFSKSKKLLKEIYKDHQITFYANCKYSYKDKNNMIDRQSCGYTPRNEYTKSGKVNKRARRIEWEHVIPAENFGRQFTCWREGDSQCVKSNGKAYKGRKCCSKVNKQFKLMEADMHNLVPAIGELNADRSNFRYGIIEGEKRAYGKDIDFEVDFKARRAEPKDDIRGNIARTYFYFEDTYGMKISKQERQLFNAWDKLDPVDEWEIERNKRIESILENLNRFIK